METVFEGGYRDETLGGWAQFDVELAKFHRDACPPAVGRVLATRCGRIGGAIGIASGIALALAVIGALWWDAQDHPNWWSRHPPRGVSLLPIALGWLGAMVGVGGGRWWARHLEAKWRRPPSRGEDPFVAASQLVRRRARVVDAIERLNLPSLRWWMLSTGLLPPYTLVVPVVSVWLGPLLVDWWTSCDANALAYAKLGLPCALTHAVIAWCYPARWRRNARGHEQGGGWYAVAWITIAGAVPLVLTAAIAAYASIAFIPLQFCWLRRSQRAEQEVVGAWVASAKAA